MLAGTAPDVPRICPGWPSCRSSGRAPRRVLQAAGLPGDLPAGGRRRRAARQRRPPSWCAERADGFLALRRGRARPRSVGRAVRGGPPARPRARRPRRARPPHARRCTRDAASAAHLGIDRSRAGVRPQDEEADGQRARSAGAPPGRVRAHRGADRGGPLRRARRRDGHRAAARATGARALDERAVGDAGAARRAGRGARRAPPLRRGGRDVITTNTWGLASALLPGGPRLWDSSRPGALDGPGARRARGWRAARRPTPGATASAPWPSPSTATSTRRRARRRSGCSPACGPRSPPDLLLLETVTLLRPSLDATLERLLATGLPVWLSFRRCRHGVCGVYGEHWGGPEGDGFGRAARRFEEMGVGALLVNCIPPDHVDGMVAYLRDFTDLPLGAYPNLGYLTNDGWRNEPGVGGEEYAALALRWREEGAQIIGGCCGTGPEHIAAARERLGGNARRAGAARPRAAGAERRPGAAPPAAPTWTDRRGRPLYPLPFPDLVCDPGVFVPSGASFLAWRHLAREGIGARRRCLDVGCGTGILTVQLALNGAAHVHAIDIDPRAVANTLTNAFRNDVADRVTAAAEDLLPWVPEERYEVIVASLCQQPVDPFQPGRRPPADGLLGPQPRRPAPGQAARGACARGRRLRRPPLHPLPRGDGPRARGAGLVAEVADVAVLPVPARAEESRTQVRRVEELSDAHHLELGGHDAVVAYLLEIRHARGGRAPAGPPWRGGAVTRAAAPDDAAGRVRGAARRRGPARRAADALPAGPPRAAGGAGRRPTAPRPSGCARWPTRLVEEGCVARCAPTSGSRRRSPAWASSGRSASSSPGRRRGGRGGRPRPRRPQPRRRRLHRGRGRALARRSRAAARRRSTGLRERVGSTTRCSRARWCAAGARCSSPIRRADPRGRPANADVLGLGRARVRARRSRRARGRLPARGPRAVGPRRRAARARRPVGVRPGLRAGGRARRSCAAGCASSARRCARWRAGPTPAPPS